MLSNSFRQARAAATGAVLALTAGLAGLLVSPVHAQSSSRTNVATVAAPAGLNDTDPANNTGTATVTVNTAAAYSFCAAPNGTAAANDIYSIVNNGIARYAPGAGADANVPELAFPTGVTGDLNALMVDPTTDRLLFHRNNEVWAYDADNGGWYVAASGAPLNQNFPRGGFNASGTGYLVLGGGNPAVVRLDPSGPFNYTATSLGNLTFDVTPTGSTGSGDIAFDGAGNAWMLVGRDLYIVNFTTMQAVRQTRPLLNGAVPTIDFAGIAFAEDGSLYLGFNGSAAYYQYDFATGELTQTGTASAAGSRDLASCAFPVPPEADLGAVKTLAEVNGAPYVAGSPVSAGDTLTYAITLSNTGTAVGTLYPGDVIESVPANTTYVAAGNTFTQAAGADWTIASAVNVPAGGSAVLNFVVQVNDPLPAGVTSVANNVTFPPGDLIDCTDAGNDCSETTPVGPSIVTTKTSDPVSGSSVTPGQTITYTLNVVVSNAATTAPLTLTDTIGAGLTFGAVTSAGAFSCNAANPLVCTLPVNTPIGSYPVTYTATVDAGAAAGTTVANSVATDPTNNGGDQTPSCPTTAPCTTEHDVVAAPNLVVGKTGPANATVGVAYDYQIVVTNNGGAATTADATVTDTVPTGLTINTAAGCTIAGQVVTCTVPTGLSNVAPNNTASFTINVTPQASTANTTVTNTASVSGGGDPDCAAVGSCPSPPVDTVIGAPDLSITKTGPATATVGVAYDYVVTVTNTGASATADATVTDAVPAGLTINSVTPAANCAAAGQNVTCTIPQADLEAGESVAITINVTPQASTSGTTVTNTANVGGGGDPDCATVGSCPSPPVNTDVGAPNLEVGKTGPANATVGVAYDYVVTVTNTGTAATTADATVTDTVPTGLTINTAAGCTIAGQVVTCTVPTGLAVGASASFTINVTPQASTAGTTLTNIASVGGGGDPDCVAVGDCESPPVDTDIGVPDLSAAKTGPANATVGVAYDYVVTVTNTGTSATTAPATVTDIVPTGLTINTAAGCTIAGQTVTCTVPTGLSNVAPNNTASFTINVTPQASTANTTVTNTASVGGGGDPDCAAVGSCPSPPVNTVIGAPDLSIAKSGPANATVGVAYDYVVTVTNTGASATAAVTVTDAVPAGLTINSVTPAANCAAAGQNVTCTIPQADLEAGESVAITINVTPQASTSGTTVTNTANVGGGGDPDCATVGSCPSPPVDTTIGAPNLSVAKTGPANATVGVAYDYQIVVTNTGDATTAPATVTDTVPTGLTINTAAGCTIAGQVVTCTVPANLATGATANFTINVTPQASTSGTTVTNTASVTGGGDPDCAAVGDCPSPPVDTTIGAPDLSVGKTGPANATVGVAYDYVVTVTNTGTAATTAPATVTDTVPTGLTINTAAGCTIAGQTVTCTVPTGLSNVAPNNTASFTINVTPQASTANTTVTNIASVSGGGDPDCAAVGSCPSPPVNTDIGAPNLDVGKTGPANATVGVAYDYVVTVTNTGTAATTAPATVTDTVPAGLTINAAPGCTIAGQTVTCPVPTGLAVGASASFTINVTPQASTANTTVTNTASVSGGGDPDCAAVGDCPSPPVNTDIGAPNLEVGKTGPANATVGVAYDYTITVSNTGTAATTAPATVTDTVPTGLTINTAAGCTITGQTVTCPVPTGLAVGASASFTINVTPQASTANTTVTNTASVSGGGDPDCVAVGDCESPPVNTDIGAPNLEVGKTGPATATVGVAYDYVVTVTNTGTAATTADATVTDTVPTGLTINTAAGCTIAGQVVTCTVPTGLAVGASASFTINVTPQASTAGTTLTNTASVNGGGDPDCTAVGDCESPPVETQVTRPVVTFNKSSDPASGEDVEVGEVITYTLSVTVGAAPTLSDVVLTDTAGAGLGNITVTSLGAFTGGFAGNTGTFTLASGTAPGTYTVVYTATVQADAGTTVGNNVVATGGNPPPGPGQPPAPQPTCDPTCTTEHNVVKPAVTVAKSADPLPGTDVAAGDTITYTLTVTVANASLLSNVVLTDTLGAGLTFGAVTSPGAFACNAANLLVCTLPSGTAPGTYAVQYTATVDVSAATTVQNRVEATGGNDPLDPDNPQPDCTICTTEHNVVAPVITVAKSSTPGSGTEVRAGDTIAYTLTVTVARSATLDTLTLTDTLGEGLTFGAVTSAGAFACTGTLTCTLPAGTPAGTYALTYTATVDPDATRIVSNVVTATGGTGTGGSPPTCGTCSTEHPLADPRVAIAKSSTPGSGQEVNVGDTIEYTLTVTVENSATLAEVRLIDTPGPGLALGALPAGCVVQGATAVCTLAAGTVPGVYTFTYPATVTADASGQVRNVVVGESGGGDPECTSCETFHEVVDEAQLRIVKAVAVRNVNIGDLVRYTLTVENVGAVNVTGATVVDTPPAGFSYVEGSMAVADRDDQFTLAGKHPLRIGGLDIDAGGRATIVYLLRVGAGVRPGVHVNEAVAVNESGDPISNVATAQVTLDSDPLLDDSLIFGTVFDDRDGDGWQDRADLSELRVQGGFAPGAYIAGSTTIDRGDGPQPVADASAPLLHGIDVGAIAARQSEGDPIEAHRVTIRQRLRATDFTGDFALTSAQGVTVRMDAAGNTTVERSGEAAKGLNAAEPTVQRTVSAVDGGFEVAYVISNAGIDERGIPGVRIASVEGLLIETDQYGRYHLADVHGGDWGRGRNFILKVDPATLPPGTVFTTENPRVRRVTPGIPVRFDFGVKLPVQVLPGGERKVELELGEVIFAPASAEVREAYLPAIRKMAERVDEYRGGDVVIVADGSSEALAFARAAAVRDVLQGMVGAEAQPGLSVVLRTQVNDPHSLVAGVDAGGALLGTVLFDTDKSSIRPEFEALLDAVAKRLDALGGGVVAIVGHTDVRASHAYNAALGLRRATSVQQALAKRLSPEVRAKVRVEASSDPAAPVGTERK